MAKWYPYTTPNYATLPFSRQFSHNPTEIEIHKERDLCRVERSYGKYGGYKKDILKENLTERDNVLLVCEICEGIMREACISSSGKQFCYCCGVRDPVYPDSEFEIQSNTSQQTPNVAVRKMINSLKCSCPLLERGCEWLGSLNDCENHLDTCGYVRDQCELGCKAILQRNKIKTHKEERCPQRKIRCEHCHENCKSWQLIVHTELCPKVRVSCKLGCGTNMCRENMSQHLKKDCSRVVETCKLGCEMKLPRQELPFHLSDKCELRMIKCDYCKGDFKFSDLRTHEEKCPKMNVKCDLNCGEELRRENMAQHLEQECGLVKEKCKLGCGMKLTRDELRMHVTDTCVQREIACEHCGELSKFRDMSKHLDRCPKIEVSCELCVKVIFRKDIAEHLEQECVMKEIECPFAKYKCEVGLIKRKDLHIHLEEKETKHLGLKVNAMEEILLEQSENVKTHKKEMKITINRMTEHINVLCSISNTTKLDWSIENISKFIQIDHKPEPRKVAGRDLNIYFLKQYIHVGYAYTHGYCDSFSAKFLIRLYSTIKCKVVKEYDCSSLVRYRETHLGEDIKEIARISKSDVEDLSREGCANKLILEMYITIR